MVCILSIFFHLNVLLAHCEGLDTREGNLVQKVCVVLHLRLLDEDNIYPRADLPGSGSKILSRLNQLPPVGPLGYHTPLHTATNAIH